MWPNPDDIGIAVAEDARELSNTHTIGDSRPLDEWIVASQRVKLRQTILPARRGE
jgi:hypothetical protein